jgi:hypothetical protein
MIEVDAPKLGVRRFVKHANFLVRYMYLHQEPS